MVETNRAEPGTIEAFRAMGYNWSVSEALEGRELTVADVRHLSPLEVFEHFLEWNGIIGYTELIRDALDNARSVEIV